MEIHAICSARNREDQTVGGLIQNCGVGMWTVWDRFTQPMITLYIIEKDTKTPLPQNGIKFKVIIIIANAIDKITY